MSRRASVIAVAIALAFPGTASAITNPQIPGLQVALRAHGFYGGAIDGVAGPHTARGVRAFQRSHGLRADGLAGPRTRRALGRLGRPFFGRRDLVRGQIGWDVSVLQFLLARRGFPTPRVNGNFGQGTQRSTVPSIARTNRIDPSNLLLIGTRLRVPVVTLPEPSAGARSWLVRSSIDHWSSHYGVDPHLARGLAWMESGFQSNLTSPAGAWGVMQVTPETWDYVEKVLVGAPIPHTADGNVRVGIAYLAHILREFNGDERLSLAAWYQGPASVRRRGLLRESKAFVADVLALKARM